MTFELSVVLDDALEAYGLGPDDVIEPWPDNALVSFTAGEARQIGLVVVRVPRTPTKVDDAHGFVCGKKTTATKKALLAFSHWEIPPPGACARPAGGAEQP